MGREGRLNIKNLELNKIRYFLKLLIHLPKNLAKIWEDEQINQIEYLFQLKI